MDGRYAPVHTRLDVAGRAVLFCEQLVGLCHLGLGRDDQGDHASAVAGDTTQRGESGTRRTRDSSSHTPHTETGTRSSVTQQRTSKQHGGACESRARSGMRAAAASTNDTCDPELGCDNGCHTKRHGLHGTWHRHPIGYVRRDLHWHAQPAPAAHDGTGCTHRDRGCRPPSQERPACGTGNPGTSGTAYVPARALERVDQLPDLEHLDVLIRLGILLSFARHGVCVQSATT